MIHFLYSFIFKCKNAITTFSKSQTLHNSRGIDKVPVCSRPVTELALNYYNYKGDRCDLNVDLLLKGKLASMQDEILGGVNDNAMITGRQFKVGVGNHLPGAMKPEYALITYRDYSPWALRNHPRDVDGSWNPLKRKFAKKYLAIEVGAEPGTFHELNESQFVVGGLKLHRTKMGRQGKAFSMLENTLDADQFAALANIRDERERESSDSRPNSSSSYNQQSSQSQNWMDVAISYTPLGYYRRVRDETYKAIGSGVVTVGVTAFALFVIYRYTIKPFFPSSKPSLQRRGSWSRREPEPSLFPAIPGVSYLFDRILTGS